MKIDKVIMSCDDNPLYADFWKPVSEVWKKRFDIDPVLIYFGDNKLDETFGQVIPVKPIEGIPSYAQAQWARFWFPTLELNTVQIISDIDMFPISRSFFIDQLEAIPDDQYVHLFGNNWMTHLKIQSKEHTTVIHIQLHTWVLISGDLMNHILQN